MSDLRSDLRVLAGYSVALLPLCFVLMFVMEAAFAVSDALVPPFQPRAYGLALNLVPPALLGLVAYGVLARRWAAPHPSRPLVLRHLVRTGGLYALVLWFGFIFLRRPGGSDFGLWAQLVLWPLAMALGGIAADAAVAFARRRRHGDPARIHGDEARS